MKINLEILFFKLIEKCLEHLESILLFFTLYCITSNIVKKFCIFMRVSLYEVQGNANINVYIKLDLDKNNIGANKSMIFAPM